MGQHRSRSQTVVLVRWSGLLAAIASTPFGASTADGSIVNYNTEAEWRLAAGASSTAHMQDLPLGDLPEVYTGFADVGLAEFHTEYDSLGVTAGSQVLWDDFTLATSWGVDPETPVFLTWSNNFSFRLEQPTTSFMLHLGTAVPMLIRLYSGNTVVGSTYLFQSGNVERLPLFRGWSSDIAFDRVRFEPNVGYPGGASTTYLKDVSFGVPIPAPAGIAFMSVMLPFVKGRRRR